MRKFLILVLVSSSLLAQSAGESGLAFLKFGFGARNIAMGDLGVSTAKDLTALHYNPSLLINRAQLLFTHNSLFQDLNSEMFAGSFTALGLPIAIGINTTTISDIEVRTRPGEPETKFNAHYFSGSISSALEIIENFSIGASIKYLYENLFSDEASGLGFDFGVSYKNLIKGLNIGASIRNLGSMNELRADPTKLPADLRLGVSYNFSPKESKFDFTALTGYQKYILQSDSHLHVGGEAVYDKMFALRIGYASGYDSKNISTGFGIYWKGINLDYAYAPVKYNLGDTHIITVVYTFN